MRGLEVGHARGADPTLGDELLDGLPGLAVQVAGRGRPVNQVEVEVVQAQLGEAGVEGPQGGVVALVGVPQLGGDEQLLTGDPGGGEGAADTGLVAVDRGGVDAAVTGLQGGAHRGGGLVVGDLEDAEAELRDLDAVVESDGGDDGRCHDVWPFRRYGSYGWRGCSGRSGR